MIYQLLLEEGESLRDVRRGDSGEDGKASEREELKHKRRVSVVDAPSSVQAHLTC